MLNLTTSRLKSGCTALTVCVLAAVVVPIAASAPAQAQDHSEATPPGAPRNLNLTLSSGDIFEIAWDPPADDGGAPVTTYHLEVWSSGESQGEGWFGASERSTTFFGETNRVYDVYVAAVNRAGRGPYAVAEIATARDANGSPSAPDDATVPSRPRNLHLTLIDSDSFRIAWDPPTSDGGAPVLRYTVEVYFESDLLASASVDSSTRESRFDGELSRTYDVCVSAVNRAGAGSCSVAEITTSQGGTQSADPDPGDLPSAMGDEPSPRRQLAERSVTISLGADNSGSNYCPYSQLACRWVNITLTNFPAGTYLTRCVWWHSESSSERFPISRNINHGGSSSANVNRLCSFNVREGRSIYVTIDGVRSNTLRFPAKDSGSASPPGSSQNGDLPPTMDEERDQVQVRRPGPPRNLRLTLTDDDSFRITWDPPSDNGGSPVTGYTLEVSRPRLSASVGPWSDTFTPRGTSFRFDGRKGATYSVRVSAKNRVGTGDSAGGEIATAQGNPPGVPRNLRVELQRRRTVVSWDPPADGSASTIVDYTVTYKVPFEPARSYAVDGDRTVHERADDRGNVTYRVTVVANNSSGSSPGLDGEFTTIGRYAHEPVVSIPAMRDSEKDEVPQVPGRYNADWNKKGWGGGTGGQCGRFTRINCAPQDGFWHTKIESVGSFAPTYVYWDDFGSRRARGSYSIEFFVPGDDARAEDGSNRKFDASATARYTIKERRSADDSWRIVGYFVVDQGEFRGKQDTWDISHDLRACYSPRLGDGFGSWEYDERSLSFDDACGVWELEGKVRIELQGKDGELAADSIRLVQRDLLSVDKRIAIARCQMRVLDVLIKLEWIGLAYDVTLGLAQSAAVSLISAGLASPLIAGGLIVQVKGGVVVVGNLRTWVVNLNKLLKVYGDLSNIYLIIQTVESLRDAIKLKISEQLPSDRRELYEFYHESCDYKDGVTGDAAWLRLGFRDAVRQFAVRSGYLDYLNPDDVS